MMTVSKLLEVAWECVHFCEHAQVKDLDELRLAGIKIFQVDLNSISNKGELLASLAAAMSLPEYFGMNWDALDECLQDLENPPAKGYLLVARNAEGFWRRNPRIAAQLIQSWMYSAGEWSEEGVSFHLVFVW